MKTKHLYIIALAITALALASCGPITLTLHPDGSTSVTIPPTVTPAK
jgi:hypothetical protein